ncbi:Patronin (microtubule-binding protein) homolog [Caenorhabditis elegans]|uniref:Patronin (microtubule-binding protein) homolog n=3 Tax=Caenorhabditis elegans TaxID=6239 RepID=PTRN1_CAEEL|nr:Patronin (microtubule-binding protein) homolog [Caenorhabditis elegans]U4PAZ9.1 RecName: Full=Patronin (microtubule-binding protein) homolog [Caenorhabditis elegans]CDH92934.1 Patronin (microtubule-binding protein) homolog [Caenorhabditis elegans]|eukprot:NP_001294846.1 Patronin (microtubule-binding protein) homolog [Caenorhabditis elegans]
MDFPLPALLAIEDYDENEGKLAASIRWLISRVYEEKRDMPDKLRDGVQRDENGHFQIDEAVVGALCNGSLYAQAAAKIFKESALVTKGHGAVLAVLTDYGIDVLHDGNELVEEAQLVASAPFNMSAHLAIIDALMMAHLRDVIPVSRVVEAVSRHTAVEPSEKPIDSVDALLFWINKICLLVRDDVEREDSNTNIPEMEDLYEDISDGQCLCALLHWYRPHEMPVADISFNDSATTRDCQYNLMLLQLFCRHHLAVDPFHFEIEDLLYLRDSLQMNVNAFLADLFVQFEPPVTPEPVETPRIGPSPRRFVPASAIPDLRAANAAARSSMHNRNRPRMYNPPPAVSHSQGPSRSVSRMSQDSLFYSRPASIALQRRSMDQDSVTDFQTIRQGFENQAGTAQLNRYDGSVTASVRLAMEEKRRKHDQQMAQMSFSSANETERLEKSKAAFFALRKNDNDQTSKGKEEWYDHFEAKLRALELRVGLEEGEDGTQSARLNRASSQPSVVQAGQTYPANYMTLPMNAAAQMTQSYIQHPQTPHDYYMQQQMQQQQQQQAQAQSNYASPSQLRNSLSNGMINHAGYIVQSMYPGDYQQQQQQMQMQQGQMPVQPVGAYTPEGYFIPHHMQPIPVQQGYQQMPQPGMGFNGMPATSQPGFNMEGSPAQMGYIQTANKPLDMEMPMQQQPPQQPPQQMLPPNQNAFHLHSKSDDATQVQADPPLEINRNLTNWGMTYKQEMPARSIPSRRTWQNETFIKNELDLVNSKESVPHITDETTTQPEEAARRFPDLMLDNHSENLAPGRGFSRQNDRDDLSTGRKSDDSPTDTPGRTFDDDEGSGENMEKIANERRIAKKAALIAKTMKRKEEIETKVDLAEQRNAERRQVENEKKELALRKKVEKEQQRQKILDEYKRKKLEKELGAELSARSTGRGHSQPPFIRTKSQMSEVTESSRQNTPRMRGQSSVEQRVSVSSLAEPTHKLYAKTVTKSNRGLINNALQFSVFPGAVNNATRQATITQMASSSSKHFLILFRDQKCQYRGLYTWDEISDTAVKISGQGPPKCTEAMMNSMFKYDSGAKNFTNIATKHLSATIDGFAILDQYWQKARIPHSGTPAHKNN